MKVFFRYYLRNIFTYHLIQIRRYKILLCVFYWFVLGVLILVIIIAQKSRFDNSERGVHQHKNKNYTIASGVNMGSPFCSSMVSATWPVDV